MYNDSAALLQAALAETLSKLGPSNDHYRAALKSVLDDIRTFKHRRSGDQSNGKKPLWRDLPWSQFRDGIEAIALRCQGIGAAALLKYRPGASVPRHLHTGPEHVVVLSGTQADERGTYRRGATVLNPTGSSHRVISPNGCIVGIYWEKPVRFSIGWAERKALPTS